jgi:hypothetical protein
MSTEPTTSSIRYQEFFAFLISAIRTQYQLVPDWLLSLLFLRVERIRNRMLPLLEQLRAGTYRAPKPRAPRPETTAPAPKRERRHFPAHLAFMMPADARLPTRFAWLHHLLHDNLHRRSGPAAAGLLHDILQTDPDLEAYARACPALARHLRALCHMLGLKQHVPAYLKLPPRARKPRPPKPPREKPKKFVIYKYWRRPRHLPAERLKRFAKKSSKW